MKLIHTVDGASVVEAEGVEGGVLEVELGGEEEGPDEVEVPDEKVVLPVEDGDLVGEEVENEEVEDEELEDEELEDEEEEEVDEGGLEGVVEAEDVCDLLVFFLPEVRRVKFRSVFLLFVFFFLTVSLC